MPFHIPWLTDTIKKRGVRYLLHHYLGQFFEEKLTLEQLSIDIYEGKGSIKNLALDVNGLNDELDFLPFKFLDGCLIGHIRVEVPWSSLTTDACQVELDGALFVCRLKTASDGTKINCTDSTLLMTSSMQMAEDIVITEDGKKDENKMFEGLEMFAQLIDSVLRRTKLTARNTLFQIQPSNPNNPSDSVEFFIKYFRCEEKIEENFNLEACANDEDILKKPLSSLPETITKQLTLEDVEMRIGGIPISNLTGKHTIVIKLNNGLKKSEISIFSGSPLLAVIGNEQLNTFFNVFDNNEDRTDQSAQACNEKNQQVMSPEDYAKIEDQLLKTAYHQNQSELDGCMGSSNNLLNGRRWVDSGQIHSNMSMESDSPNSSSTAACPDIIEAFSCELKLPGIWLCILKDGETLPPLIQPYADSFNSFQSINKYIEQRIKVPHIRILALKVALYSSSTGINVSLGDLDISEHLHDNSMQPTLNLFQSDLANQAMSSASYKASIVDGKDITIDFLAATRVIFDPTMIDRICYDYKLLSLNDEDGEKRQKKSSSDLNLTIKGKQFNLELLCPIPDLTPEGPLKPTQLRPQSFLFDFKDIVISWQSEKLNASAIELVASVKSDPKQSDSEAIKFIESTGKNNDRIVLTLEPSPSSLDNAFPSDIDRVLNESSMYDSIYVGQATESRIPTEAFQTKRKVVRASGLEDPLRKHDTSEASTNDCDNEKIIAPGDRQHLMDYLNQTVSSTKLSLNLHLPICEVEFEDKEQLDLIYNRFGNDFVFWQPKALIKVDEFNSPSMTNEGCELRGQYMKFKRPTGDSDSEIQSDQESEVSYHSLNGADRSSSELYTNQTTCKIMVDELFVRFNHQSCAAALKQEISAENLLLGVVIDVDKKPNTIISLVADNLELCNETETVLEGNSFGDENSTFGLTAEIKRPTKSLKDIKLAIQLTNGLFNEFKMSTYTRFWQSINVTDEPILGYVAPKIVTELHINVMNTALSLVREGARPALLAIDELYLTSMVMEKTSQVMIRLIADEVALYLKRNKQGLENMKNYICLIDSGLVDLNLKFADDGRLEFGVINNVITVRACQDSLSALCKFVDVMIKTSSSSSQTPAQRRAGVSGGNANGKAEPEIAQNVAVVESDDDMNKRSRFKKPHDESDSGASLHTPTIQADNDTRKSLLERETNLLNDAMNDFEVDEDTLTEPAESQIPSKNRREGVSGSSRSSSESDNSGDEPDDESDGSGQSSSGESQTGSCDRDPNACILDEPCIGNLFSPPPLQPASSLPHEVDLSGGGHSIEQLNSTSKAIDESGFFVIGDDDVGAGIMNKQQSEPVVRKLTQKPITVVENHFKMTKPRTIPEMLATSLERYVLEEMTLVVNLYGGRDFDDEPARNDTDGSSATNTTGEDQEAELLDTISIDSGSIRSRTSSIASVKRSPMGNNKTNSIDYSSSGSLKRRPVGGGRRKHLSESSRDQFKSAHLGGVESRVRFGEGIVNLWESLDLMSSPDFLGSSRRGSQPTLSSDSKHAGGTWRQNDVCIQLTLSKVKLLYELAEEGSPISWRFMLFVHDIEIKDKIHASDINKLLYEYCTESMPKRNTQILTIKNVATINPSDGCEECDLRVSLKPLRLNIDQDTLLFLIEFFTSFIKSVGEQKLVPSSSSTTATTTTTTSTSSSSPHQPEASASASSSTSPDKASSSAFGRLGKGTAAAAAAAAAADGKRGGGDVKASSSCAQAERQRRSQAITIDGAERRRQQREEGAASSSLASQGSYCSAGSSSSGSANLCPGSLSATSRSYNDDENCSAGISSTLVATDGSTRQLRRRGEPELRKGEHVEEKKGTPHDVVQRVPSGDNNELRHQQHGDRTDKDEQGDEDEDEDEYHETASGGLPTHCHRDGSGSANQQHSIYIKSFTFSPDVPIRLDYHAKHLDFEQGALAGILMGLAHLDHSELVLRRVQAKHGMRGLDRVLLFTLNSWLNDIKRNQLPSILSGVGPMHSVIQLFQGMRDLIWMPIDHYRKDRRLVRGLQRGASSFSSSTAMAAINLVNRFISIVQCTAQIAHDIVTPPSLHATSSSSAGQGTGGGGGLSSSNNPSGAGRRRAKLSSRAGGGSIGSAGRPRLTSGGGRHSHSSSSGSAAVAATTLNQPRNFCEGVAVGFSILKEGFNDTARNVAVGMQAEDMRSAVGELVRQIPSTLLNPIISATEGAQNVLVGIRNQIAPDARRDDQEKWKRRVRGK